MPPLKLYLNEHLSPRLAEQLRQHGFDVTSTLESKMGEADDDEQLAHAASGQRALVTFNHKDFAERHERYIAEGKEHWGIVLSTEEPVDVKPSNSIRWGFGRRSRFERDEGRFNSGQSRCKRDLPAK